MDTSTQGCTPPPKPTRYRLACDRCQHSKIRCDQERPNCRRCAKRGMECIYNPARRAGRPRTRNTNKSSTKIRKSASSGLNKHSIPITEQSDVPILASGWISPFAPPDMLSASEDCFSSSSCSNAATVPTTQPEFCMLDREDVDFSHYQQRENNFLQIQGDFTDSQDHTPKETTDRYYPISPEFCVASELLDMSFCEAGPGHQRQQGSEYNHFNSTTIHLDAQLPYFDLLTPEEQHTDQKQGDTTIQTTNCNAVESCAFTICSQQDVRSDCEELADHTYPSMKPCSCVSTLLNQLSIPSYANSTTFLASTSTALATSRMLVTCCCTTMECPNACSTRPSTALIISEAINQAMALLKLDGLSLWTPTVMPVPGYRIVKRSSPSSSPSPSNPGGHGDNDEMLYSSVIDEEHEPLRCGTLLIRGSDKRALMRILLAKRVLDMQLVLERLRDTLLSGLLIGGHTAVKKPLVTLCADIVGEFAGKIAKRVETAGLKL